MLGCAPLRLFAALCLLNSAPVRAESLEQFAETPILKFHAERNPLKVGEGQTLFVQANVGFTKNEVVLESFLDGVRVEMSQTAPALWILAMNAFSEVKPHIVEVRIFIRNAQEASRIREALSKLATDIADLNSRINLEQDEAKRNVLIAIRDEKQAASDRLETDLSSLKVYFKSEIYAFEVLPDSNNSEFPQVLSLQPNIGATAGGTVVEITGTNFPSSMVGAALPIVKFGGVNASVVSANGNIVSVVTPAFAISGSMDVEIAFPSPTNPKNAIKKNAFFATASSSIATNFRPVAVTNGYQLKNWPNPGQVTLGGTASYDENGDGLAYTWTIKAVAKNSSLIPGAVIGTTPNVIFTPDKKGVFSFELKVREASTPQSLESFPATATVEVN